MTQARKPKPNQAFAQGNSAANRNQYDSDDDSDDDGLGRIRPNNNQSSSALPAGIGQVFNMNNPLAAAKTQK